MTEMLLLIICILVVVAIVLIVVFRPKQSNETQLLQNKIAELHGGLTTRETSLKEDFRTKREENSAIANDNRTELNHTLKEFKSELIETKKPNIRSTKKKVVLTDEGFVGQLVSDSGDDSYGFQFEIPDILSYIQGKTELTRTTILEVLKKSGRINELLLNPQLFMDNAGGAIKSVLNELMIDGIKYEKIGSKVYEMTLFEANELEIYLDQFTHIVTAPDKTIYENYIPLDSKVESDFAKDCESSENIEFYFKLPFWFKIDTPIGSYNPDWALVFKGEKKIYFVAETKGEGQELRGSEKMKIKCGTEHFKKFEDVVYKRVSKVSELNS
jgi:type III restriction enzyme